MSENMRTASDAAGPPRARDAGLGRRAFGRRGGGGPLKAKAWKRRQGAGVGSSFAPRAARALLMLALAAALVAQAPVRAGAQQADRAAAAPSQQQTPKAASATPPTPPSSSGSSYAEVASAAELLAALEDPAVATVVLSRPVRLPPGWGPAVIDRPVTVTSSIRAVVDFCGDGCGAGGGGGKQRAGARGAAGAANSSSLAVGPEDIVRLVVAPSGTLSFHRVFLRNWAPPEGSPAADAAARDAAAAAAGPDGGDGGGEGEAEAAALASAAAAAAPDASTSPLPGVRLMPGAALSMSLAVVHWTADAMWLLQAEGGWWRRAADAGAILALEGDGRGAVPGPLVDDGRPRLHSVKGYAADGGAGRSVHMSDCYMPFDMDGCLARDAPFDEALVYCPYTTYDALRNPHVAHVRVFHPVGLDRLAYSPRNPLVVARRVQIGPCSERQASEWPIVFDMDNVTASVLVDTGGSLALSGMTFQGSRGQPKGGRAWPGDLPLLLGAFQPVGSGRISVRGSVLRVPSPRAVREALDAMPSGQAGGLESPDLAPVYAGEEEEGRGGGLRLRRRRGRSLLQRPGRSGSGRLLRAQPRPGGGRAPGDESPFTIASWSITTGQWQRYVHGGLELGPGAGMMSGAPAGFAGGGMGGGLASWTFDDLRVERWEVMAGDGPNGGNDRHCFHGSLTQSAVSIEGVLRVSTGAELRDALRDPSARYVQVVADMAWPDDDADDGVGDGDGDGDGDGPRAGGRRPQVRVNRVVEVRACRNGDGGGDGGPFTLDWSRAPPGAVQVGGSLYFEGDMRMVGLGWRQQRAAQAAAAAEGGALASAQAAPSAASPGPPLPIPAVRPVGDGQVAYEDVELAGEVTLADWESDVGRGFVSGMLGGIALGAAGLPRAAGSNGSGSGGGGAPGAAYRLQLQQQPFAARSGVNYTLEAPARLAFAHLAVTGPEAAAAAGLPPGTGTGIGRELFLRSSMVWGPPGWPGAAMPISMSGGGGGKTPLSPGAAAAVGVAVGAGVLLAAAAGALLVARARRRRRRAAGLSGNGLGGKGDDGALPLTGGGDGSGGDGSGSPPAGCSDGSAGMRWWPPHKASLLFGSAGGGGGGGGGSATNSATAANGLADSATSHLVAGPRSARALGDGGGGGGRSSRRPSTDLSSSGGHGGALPPSVVAPAPLPGALRLGGGGGGGGGKELSLSLGPAACMGVAARMFGGGTGANHGMMTAAPSLHHQLIMQPPSSAQAAAGASPGSPHQQLLLQQPPGGGAVAAWSASQALRDAAAAGGLADEHVVLEGVLGEGAHGRVYRGRWRGAAVAVKVVRLPAAPPTASGGRRGGAAAASSRRERRRRMALMEIAISASLSHPNIVQTYTYAVVESPLAGARTQDDDEVDEDEGGGGGGGNNAFPAAAGAARLLEGGPAAAGNGGGGPNAPAAGGAAAVNKPPNGGGGGGDPNDDGGGDGSTNDDSAAGGDPADADADADADRPGGAAAADYELRIIQEYCDRGSLRDLLRSRGHALSRTSAETVDEEDESAGGGGGGGGGSTAGSGAFAGAAALQSLRQGRRDLRRRLRFLAVLDTATDVARAGAHLHAQQLLHADIKTSNVLLKTTVAPPPSASCSAAPPHLSSLLSSAAAAAAAGFWASGVSTALAEGGNGGGGQEEAELLAAAAAAAITGAGVPGASAVDEASALAAAAARLLPPRGFVAKVADFGLTRRLEGRDDTHVSGAFVGTLSHMAPEVLLKGRVSRQSDVYAYGVLLYELFSGARPFRGVPRALLGHGVARDGLRPSFPPDAPFDYALLAARCWESDPALRPSFDDALRELARQRRRAAQEAAAVAIAVAAAERAAAAMAAVAAAAAGGGGNGGNGHSGAWASVPSNHNSGEALAACGSWRGGTTSAASLAALAMSAASVSAAAAAAAGGGAGHGAAGAAGPLLTAPLTAPLPHAAAPAAATTPAAAASAPQAAAAAIAAAAATACAHPARPGGSSCGEDDDDDDEDGGGDEDEERGNDTPRGGGGGGYSGDTDSLSLDGGAPLPRLLGAPSGPLVAMPDGDGTFGDSDATFGVGASRGAGAAIPVARGRAPAPLGAAPRPGSGHRGASAMLSRSRYLSSDDDDDDDEGGTGARGGADSSDGTDDGDMSRSVLSAVPRE